MKNQKRLNNSGFSLVELIVVIAIMAVLMGVLAPTLINNIEKSRESTDLQNLDTIRGAAVTAMANEAVYREVMEAMGTNSAIVFNLGTSDSATVSSMSASTVASADDTSLVALLSGEGTGTGTNTSTTDVDKFVAEMQSIITSSIAMKSTAACAEGNEVYVIINENGNVVAIVAEEVADADYTPVQCRRTEDEEGELKYFISGAEFEGEADEE